MFIDHVCIINILSSSTLMVKLEMQVRVEDNVRAQYKLVTEKFGIRRLKLVIGWSMGAGQAFQWATSFPDMVERILPFCGSARTSPHNLVSSNYIVCGFFLIVL
jgi:homoserine acetyltransferase